MPSDSILRVENVTMQFGGLKAIDQMSFQIAKGSMCGLIGPNGAGKTTAFNVLTGVYTPSIGEVFFNEQNLRGLKPHEISRRGMTRTFQNIRLFKSLSVLENVLIAHDQHSRYSWLDTCLKNAKFIESERSSSKYAQDLLAIFKLEQKMNHNASGLPYGEQRKLEIVRTLATRPDLILLDEPAAGMNHAETEDLMHTLERIRKEFKVTILLIEHDMKLVMGICEKIIVLDHGEKIAEGSPQEVRHSQRVIEAYLGKDSDEGHKNTTASKEFL